MIVTMDHEQEPVLGSKYPIIHIKIWKLLLTKKRYQRISRYYEHGQHVWMVGQSMS